MSAYVQPRGSALPSPTQRTETRDGMSVRDVLVHVHRQTSAAGPLTGMDGWVAVVQACIAVGAARHVLNAGLGTQEALDRLVQIAIGRETAHRSARSERVAVEAVQADMRTRLSHTLTDWRRTGERFTQLTRLLPAQFSRAWPLKPALDDAQRQWMDARVHASKDASRRAEYERAKDLYRAAHRRCERAAREVAQAAGEHQRMAGEVHGGERSLTGSAQALMAWQRHVESLVDAEADRALAQEMMGLLATSST